MIVENNENIQVEKLEVEIEKTGHITNTYIVKDNKTSKIFVVDPAFNECLIKEKIKDMKGQLDSVIITHTHADHIAALAKLVENTTAKVYVHNLDYDGLYDKKINEEEIVQTKVKPVEESKVIKVQNDDVIVVGNTQLQVIHTPGHTSGSITLYDKINNILFSGDTIFEKSYGRTDLVTGSREQMNQSLNKLFENFEDITVFSGHGADFNLKNSKRRIRLLFAYKG